ncbi:hypothetical protein DL89DRAFT_257130 [Linderina pennispora]|uniref:Uncharacterized protein n=1 Tax=Linderina pennispora TaxID=61395 RepID=A0A1Y1WCC1_9FUNG|nr:uncharacterized protein DL89DRAFT_257130 [Linderina pennispora]ORX70968.1 hypothetical protein DL89DRAFT_257130 [Linderina pennispora]
MVGENLRLFWQTSCEQSLVAADEALTEVERRVLESSAAEAMLGVPKNRRWLHVQSSPARWLALPESPTSTLYSRCRQVQLPPVSTVGVADHSIGGAAGASSLQHAQVTVMLVDQPEGNAEAKLIHAQEAGMQLEFEVAGIAPAQEHVETVFVDFAAHQSDACLARVTSCRRAGPVQRRMSVSGVGPAPAGVSAGNGACDAPTACSGRDPANAAGQRRGARRAVLPPHPPCDAGEHRALGRADRPHLGAAAGHRFAGAGCAGGHEQREQCGGAREWTDHMPGPPRSICQRPGACARANLSRHPGGGVAPDFAGGPFPADDAPVAAAPGAGAAPGAARVPVQCFGGAVVNMTRALAMLELSMHASEGFVFAGPRRTTLNVMPGDTAAVAYTVMPISAIMQGQGQGQAPGQAAISEDMGRVGCGWMQLPRLDVKMLGASVRTSTDNVDSEVARRMLLEMAKGVESGRVSPGLLDQCQVAVPYADAEDESDFEDDVSVADPCEVLRLDQTTIFCEPE